MAAEKNRMFEAKKQERNIEMDAVKTTIVGGRPPGSGKSLPSIPRGIEVLVKKASVDKDFRKLLLPYIEELFDEAIINNVPTFLHSCGNINLYLDDLVSVGFDGLHPLQRTAGMSMKDVREKVGQKLCLIGNVDSSYTLVTGSDDTIICETLETIHDGAVNGAMILASDSDIRDEMPFEKVDLMFRVGLEYGKYPLDIEAINKKSEECKI